MAEAKPTRKSSRAPKPKHDPDFMSGFDLESHLKSFKFPSTPLPSQTPHPTPTGISPIVPGTVQPETTTQSTQLDKQLRVLQLEKDKLELQLQVLKLQEHAGKTPDNTDENSPKQCKKRHIDWPNDFIPGMSNNTPYEKIDQSEFFAVFLCMVKPYDPALKSAMISLLELLATKAMSYSWTSVRSFYSSVAKQVELSRINWTDVPDIKEHALIFFRHSDLKPAPKATQISGSATTSSKTLFSNKDNKSENDKACKYWNYKGACKCEATAPNYAAIHVCRVCSKDHPMLQCPKRRHQIPDI